MPSSTTHILLTVLPAWGHVRPLCALAGRLVRENNNIAITILLAPNWITQAHAEIARQFPVGFNSDKIRVVSLFDSAETQIFDLFAPHAEAYPAAYAKLARGEAITCATTGTTFKALPPPAALIADFFAVDQVKATRAITGQRVPIFSFASCCAVSVLRVMGPEKIGGRGDIKARAEAEAQRTGKDVVEIGEQLFKHTEGKIVQLPGLPAVYDYEFCPQNLPFEMPMYPLISGAHPTLMMSDGIILGTLNAYDQEAISALDRWLSGLGKTIYTAGPLLPANYGSDSISSTVSPRDRDIKAFLDAILAEHGSKSTLFVLISFGTIFWPTVQEHLEELVDALTEKKFPFILAHASPFAVVSPALSAKVKASGLGMLTPWCPQQFILNHAATGLFMTHGGHGGVSESLASGMPMVCWPFEGDQPEAALHLTHNLNGKGKLPLLSGKVPQGTRAAVGAEFRSVIDDFRGSVGEEKKRNAQRMKVEYARAWEEGGSARAAVDALLNRVF
ncbi:UDP-Glycosyltransferase/glycogen phosphorylase [Mycena rebaudengoi]|nr:UDP-Glycosyltransferase/glycogen phosphorylase [Mycena rebaudengoi]